MKEYLQSKESVMSRQGVTSSGLTSAQAASRLEKNGKNKLAEGKKDRFRAIKREISYCYRSRWNKDFLKDLL